MTNKIQLTKNGLESLKTELENLNEVKRPKLVERLSRARAEGDLSENSDYINAKDELEFLDGRISELQNVVKNAQVVHASANKNEVAIGTKVTIKANGTEHTYDIVGEWEADPIAKKISHTSPLGSALVGKKKGEKVAVEAPAGKVTYTILKLH